MTTIGQGPDSELEARLTLALRRASRPLSEAERELVRQRIARSIQQRQALREAPLANGDEPALSMAPEVVSRGNAKDAEA